MSELSEHLRLDLQDEDVRYGYADAYLNSHTAALIKTLREEQGMSQQQLADKIGTQQSGISRLENANYSTWKVETLRKLARAFGLWLYIDFKEFGELPSYVENFRENALRRSQWKDDPVFRERVEPAPVSGLLQPLPEDFTRILDARRREIVDNISRYSGDETLKGLTPLRSTPEPQKILVNIADIPGFDRRLVNPKEIEKPTFNEYNITEERHPYGQSA
ncbi:MAG TPA: helix-turn-helix transcriptional regulator [Bryobacteraceae bacterium]|nr:helix-turn-helix transcriptional regulator [Bryobacteraceae bacterium]